MPGLSGSLICSSVKISVWLFLCCWTASNVNCSNSLYNLLGSLVSEFIAHIRWLHFLFWISCSCLGLCVVRAWANLFLFPFLLVHIFAQWFFFPQAEHVVPQAGHFPFRVCFHIVYSDCFIVFISWLSPRWILAICFIWLRDTLCVRPLFKASWSVSSMPLDSKSFCNSGCFVPVITCSMSRSSFSWLSLNLHFLACNLHLAMKSSIFSVFFCLYYVSDPTREWMVKQHDYIP